MGRHHAAAYARHPSCTVAAVADADPDRLAQVADEFSVPARYRDGAEMLASEDLDLVSIATPNKYHCPLTLAALERGVHVLTEKPMGLDVHEAERMRAAAAAGGLNLMVNFSYRFSRMSFALKKQVEAGVVGEIYFGRTVWHRRRGAPGFGGWFGRHDLSGGGPLIDLGVHRIDLALWLMGHPEPVAVSGSTYAAIAAPLAAAQRKPFSVEDLACGLVKFANGATLIVEASWALQINEAERMVTELYGPRGGIVQRNRGGGYAMEAELYTEEDGSFFTKRLDEATEDPPSPYQEFVESILEKRPPLATAEEGIKVQKIIDGLYESARSGKEVRFDKVAGISA
jgi:predicted dehydrogenase